MNVCKFLLVIIGIALAGYGASFYFQQKQKEDQGIIIFLNGPSSAGKSSIARELQTMIDKPLMHIGIDTFLFSMPARYFGTQLSAKEGFFLQHSIDEYGPHTDLSVGKYGLAVVTGMYESVAAFTKNGLSVVLDDVMLAPQVLDRARKQLRNSKVYFIGITCDIPVLQAREIARGDRALNMARVQAKLVHSFGQTYDLMIDTTNLTSSEAAQRIVSYIELNVPNNCFFKNE